jgi:hypothetical protein
MAQDQATLFAKHKPETRDQESVECPGITFQNDKAQRKHFSGILCEKPKAIQGWKIPNAPDI